jgi:hypothetical protein
MTDPGESPALRLRRNFNEAIATTKIGGAAVLQELSDLASDCVVGLTNAQDAVAFALSELFARHAEDRCERAVTGDDTYLLMASGSEHLFAAVKFIEEGTSADDATRIIAALARLTPKRLYGHKTI